jgi:hypothetical protein
MTVFSLDYNGAEIVPSPSDIIIVTIMQCLCATHHSHDCGKAGVNKCPTLLVV